MTQQNLSPEPDRREPTVHLACATGEGGTTPLGAAMDDLIPVHVTVSIRHGIIRAERERLGMTQREFGALVNLSNSAVSAAEHGRFDRFSAPGLKRLADVCNTTPQAILDAAPPTDQPLTQTAVIATPRERLLAYDAEDGAVRKRLELPDPSAELETAETHEALRLALSTLSYREAEIVKARYGLSGEPSKTYEGAARMFGITRERCRQIEQRAIRKLQEPHRAKPLAIVAFGESS